MNKQYEAYKKVRKTWPVPPVTKVKPSKKVYKRQKKHRHKED